MSAAETAPLIELRNVSCMRGEGGIVRGVSAAFRDGVTVLSSSEVGAKRLLLRLLGLLERPDAGDVLMLGNSTRALDDEELAALRSRHCGYVFATPFLLPGFSVAENIAMPLFKIAQVGPDEASSRTQEAIAFAEIAEFAGTRASALSSALQLRVSLARALVHRPSLVFIEEPDAVLAGEEIPALAGMLRRACETFGVACIVTAATSALATYADRVFAVGAEPFASQESTP